MSRNINVNPAHYKLAGRERQGEDIAQHLQRQAFGRQRAELERWQARQRDQVPGWENPAQPTAEPEPEPPPLRRRAPRSKPRRKAVPVRTAGKRTTRKRPGAKRTSTKRTSAKRPIAKRAATKRASTRSRARSRVTRRR